LGEIANKYLKKGSKVYVEGFLRTNKWKDQNDNDRYSTDIIANNLQMLDMRSPDNIEGHSINKQNRNEDKDFEKDKLFEEEIPF
jgi:single-strand DNA-binding protein